MTDAELLRRELLLAEAEEIHRRREQRYADRVRESKKEQLRQRRLQLLADVQRLKRSTLSEARP